MLNLLIRKAICVMDKFKNRNIVKSHTDTSTTVKPESSRNSGHNENLREELKVLKQISENTQRDQKIIDILPQIAWTTSADGNIEFFNKRWYKYTGITEITDLNKAWWQATISSDHNAIEDFWKELLISGEEADIKIRIFNVNDNSYHWHLVSLVPVKNNSNEITNWIGTGTDIHNEVIQTKQLDTKNTELQAINHYLDHFVHAIAHDLRAPVANIKMLTQILNKDNIVNKEKLIHNMCYNVDKLDNTITGLIKVIDAQGNKNPFTKNISLLDVVKDVLKSENNFITNYKANINILISHSLKFNYVKDFIKSIISNLLKNSLEYSKEFDSPNITISAHRYNTDTIKLIFEDNGIGMDIHTIKNKIFKPFSKFTEQSKGMGLGLHIIDTMVKKNGGKIEVESEINKGTKFILFLKEYE